MDLTEFFCGIDDFCQDWLATFSLTLFPAQGNTLPKYCRMSLSEVMTIVIHFPKSKYRTFKDYYLKYVCQYLTNYFPNLVSYNRMVESFAKCIDGLSLLSKISSGSGDWN